MSVRRVAMGSRSSAPSRPLPCPFFDGRREGAGIRIRLTTLSIELTGAPNKIDNSVDLMRPIGLVEVSRTGVAAISRGPEPI